MNKNAQKFVNKMAGTLFAGWVVYRPLKCKRRVSAHKYAAIVKIARHSRKRNYDLITGPVFCADFFFLNFLYGWHSILLAVHIWSICHMCTTFMDTTRQTIVGAKTQNDDDVAYVQSQNKTVFVVLVAPCKLPFQCAMTSGPMSFPFD